MCLNLWNGTQFQLDRLDVQDAKCSVLLNLEMTSLKAVERMEMKTLIVSKSTYLLIKWSQLILQPNFHNYSSRTFATRHFLISSPAFIPNPACYFISSHYILH